MQTSAFRAGDVEALFLGPGFPSTDPVGPAGYMWLGQSCLQGWLPWSLTSFLEETFFPRNKPCVQAAGSRSGSTAASPIQWMRASGVQLILPVELLGLVVSLPPSRKI